MTLIMLESGLLTQWLERNEISPLAAIFLLLWFSVGSVLIIYALLKIGQALLKRKAQPKLRQQMAMRIQASPLHPTYCEDAAYADVDGLYAMVLDGVSGSDRLYKDESGGTTASKLGINRLKVELPISVDSADECKYQLKELLFSTHKVLQTAYQERKDDARGGNGLIASTGIVCQLKKFGDENLPDQITACYGHVGDSRLHVWNPETGFKICTVDHSAMLKHMGEEDRKDYMLLLANGEVKGRPEIYSALGAEDDSLQIDTGCVVLNPGERLLITSDGLHENLYLPKLHELMSSSSNIEEVADLVMLAAVAQSQRATGKRDDISFVIIEHQLVDAVKSTKGLSYSELATSFVKKTISGAKQLIKKADQLITFLQPYFDASFKYVSQKFWEASRTGKAVMLGGAAVVVILSVLLMWLFIRGLFYPTAATEVIMEKAPYGITRSAMTAVELDMRREQYITTRGEFVVLSKPDSQKLPARMMQYRQMIIEACTPRQVDPTWLMGIAAVESNYDSDAANKDFVGMFQLGSATAASDALKNNDGDFRAIKGNRDYRKDPRSAAVTSCELFKQSLARWGDPALAVWEHHAGASSDGVMVPALTMYLDETQPNWKSTYNTLAKAVRGFKVTYWDVLFRPTPAFAPKTWAHMQKLNTSQHDYSTGYAGNVSAARRLAQLQVDDSDKFEKIIARYAKVFQKFNFRTDKNPSGVIPAEWWSQYEPQVPAAETCADVQKVIDSGKWVKSPDNPTKYGFRLDRRNEDGMGWVDKPVLARQPVEEQAHNGQHRDRHKVTSPEIIGMIMFVASHYQAAYAKVHPLRGSSVLTVTSLARSQWFQRMLGEMGDPITDKLPLHQNGKAVDITKTMLSTEEQVIMEFVLSDLRAAGFLSYSPERAAWHIAPYPDKVQFFVDYYNSHN